MNFSAACCEWNPTALRQGASSATRCVARPRSSSAFAIHCATSSRTISSSGFIDHFAVLACRVGEAADDILRLLEALGRHHDDIEGVAEPAQGVVKAHALIADIGGLPFEDQKIDVAVAGHAPGSCRTEENDAIRLRDAQDAPDDLSHHSLVDAHVRSLASMLIRPSGGINAPKVVIAGCVSSDANSTSGGPKPTVPLT